MILRLINLDKTQWNRKKIEYCKVKIKANSKTNEWNGNHKRNYKTVMFLSNISSNFVLIFK